ncbi:MAG TPA: succinate dehydrogenase iron-sulfur subunit, partial [Sedimenticola sp.]|nr:succinate dehydrogenase iron-sulfur subunit [Sedimenticola sp.]
MKFRIYRYNPDRDSAPRLQAFELETRAGMMLRDALMAIKEQQDDSLSFRHSCGE